MDAILGLLAEQTADLLAWSSGHGFRISLGVSAGGSWHAELWDQKVGPVQKHPLLPKALMIRRGREGSSIGRLLFDLQSFLPLPQPSDEQRAVALRLIALLRQAETSAVKAGVYFNSIASPTALFHFAGKQKQVGSDDSYQPFLGWADSILAV